LYEPSKVPNGSRELEALPDVPSVFVAAEFWSVVEVGPVGLFDELPQPTAVVAIVNAIPIDRQRPNLPGPTSASGR
jgi:hypothetical protein